MYLCTYIAVPVFPVVVLPGDLDRDLGRRVAAAARGGGGDVLGRDLLSVPDEPPEVGAGRPVHARAHQLHGLALPQRTVLGQAGHLGGAGGTCRWETGGKRDRDFKILLHFS